MAELVLGAALGAAFTVLQEAVNKATVGKFNKFKPLLGALQSTLESIQPLVITQIEEYNVKLELPNDEIEELDRQMREGENLIQKLSKLGWWNRLKSHQTNKLIELDGSLKRLLKHIVMQQARDIKENLIVAKKTAQQIVELQEETRRFALAQQENGEQLVELQELIQNLWQERILLQEDTRRFVLVLQENGKQLVEFQELNERLLKERTLLQEGAHDLQKTFVSALENNGKQLVHLHGVIAQMTKQQGAKEVTDADAGDSDDEWLKPNEDEEGGVVALFSLLFEGVQELINKDVICKPVLKSIESTLDSLQPLKELCRHFVFIRNKEQLKALRLQMQDGVKLFRKCSSLQTWNMYRKFKYANKLIQWDESLQREIDNLLREDKSIVRPHKSDPAIPAYDFRKRNTYRPN